MHSAAPAPSPEQFGTNSYPANAATSAAGERQPDGIADCPSITTRPVGNVLPHRITDEEREQAITRAARAIEQHMADVAEINNRVPHVFSDFADAAASRWMADRARQLMQRLIAQRSPEQVARMERERGLDVPSCANDARSA